MLLRSTLKLITSPIQSLSVYEFDRSVTALTLDLFSSANVNIRHLQFSHSNLQILKDNSLTNLRNSLESLSIVHGKLSEVNDFSSFGFVFEFSFEIGLPQNPFTIRLRLGTDTGANGNAETNYPRL